MQHHGKAGVHDSAAPYVDNQLAIDGLDGGLANLGVVPLHEDTARERRRARAQQPGNVDAGALEDGRTRATNGE